MNSSFIIAYFIQVEEIFSKTVLPESQLSGRKNLAAGAGLKAFIQMKRP